MRVLVTGASGFIGNHVINALIEKNHEIIATSTNIESIKDLSWFTKVKYIPAKIEEIANKEDRKSVV